MSASERPLLVVNPNAGGGKAKRAFPELEPVVKRALGEVDVAFTERAGHGIEIARKAAQEGRALVIALGGDGTFNEIVNGVLVDVAARGAGRAGSATAVGFIGQGTGGDFRRSLDLEHRLDQYLAALSSGRTRVSDVGLVKYRDRAGQNAERYFVNILSAGMGGLVDRYVADASRVLGPAVAYFGASVRALGTIARGRLRMTVTDETGTHEKKLATYMIAICNGRYFGAGMHVAPMAKIDDGRLEVVSIGGATKVAFAMTARSIYSGEHLGKDGTETFGCQKVAIELENARDAEATFLIDCDGEPIGGLPLEIEIVPRALTIRA